MSILTLPQRAESLPLRSNVSAFRTFRNFLEAGKNQSMQLYAGRVEEIPYIKQGVVPMGTRSNWYNYKGGGIEPRDVYTLNLPKHASIDATSMGFFGNPGTQKTTMLKRLVYYAIKLGYKVGVFDCKAGQDWSIVAQPGITDRLLPGERREGIPLRAGAPTFGKTRLPNRAMRGMDTFDIPFKTLAMSDDRSMLMTMGFSAGSTVELRNLIQQHPDWEWERMVQYIKGQRSINFATRENLLKYLMLAMSDGLLVGAEHKFDINEIWDSGMHWAIGFFSKERRYVSAYVARIMLDVFNRARTHEGEKYMLIVDDCQNVFGADMLSDKFVSVRMGIDALSQWRYCGITIVLSTQSPSFLNREMLITLKHVFVSSIGDPDNVPCNDPEIIHTIRDLVYQPEQSIVEWLVRGPDFRRFRTFYPLGSPIGHNW